MPARALCLSLALTACAPDDPVDLPAPTGSAAIGRTTLRWVDEGRPEVLTASADDRRELTVHLWYPAAPEGDEAPAPYVADLAALRAVLDGRSEAVFELTRVHAVEDAPVAATPQRLPLVVLSHGNDMLAAHYSFLIEELVSRGFAVAAVDHPHDARAVLLAHGRAIGYAASAWPSLPPPDPSGEPDPDSAYAQFYRDRVEVRAADVGFVLDRLAALDDTGPGNAVAERLDLEHVGFVGHSVGGVAAGEVCRVDARVRACLNLDGDHGDGPFYRDENDPDGEAFAQPYMMITKSFDLSDEQLAAWGLTREAWLAKLAAHRELYFGGVGGGAYRVVLAGASHSSFTDEPFVFAALEGEPTDAHQDRMTLIRRYALEFFALTLRGEPAPLLEDGAAAPPGATIERWTRGSG